MARIFLILLLFSGTLNAQRDSSQRFIHVLSAGPQLVAPEKRYSAENCILNYNNPGKVASYQLYFMRKANKYFGISLNTCYREGNVYVGYSGLSSSEYTRGTFRLQRADIGICLARSVGKRKNCFISYGIYFGKAINIISAGEYSSFSLSATGVHSGSEQLSNLSLIYEVHGGVSFSCFRQFKIKKENFLVCGFNALLETPECHASRVGKVCNIFLGYKFGK